MLAHFIKFAFDGAARNFVHTLPRKNRCHQFNTKGASKMSAIVIALQHTAFASQECDTLETKNMAVFALSRAE